MSTPNAAAEIISACLEPGSEAAWQDFVRKFQPVIAASAARVVARYGPRRPALVDDLIQETYLRLCKDNYRSLREFKAQHEEAIFGYLKVIAASVALDYFRARGTQKRRGEVEYDDCEREAVTSSASIERAALLKELEQRLATSESERDCTIFWLYYRQGYTAKDIAAIPSLGLTAKGVESCIYRLTQLLRNIIAGSPPKISLLEKGVLPQNTLGGMK